MIKNLITTKKKIGIICRLNLLETFRLYLSSINPTHETKKDIDIINLDHYLDNRKI